MLLRLLYRILWLPAPWLLRRYLRRRARANPAYAEHWNERFGKPYPNPVQGAIWIHAVSVGETHAAKPLADALRKLYPDRPLLLTQTTPTGRDTAHRLFPDAQCRYLPYDKKQWIRRFLTEHRPFLGILMETEIWPNLMTECAVAKIPLFMANARLSERSLKGYLRVKGLVGPAMKTLSGCLAQTEADAARLSELGAAHLSVCGSTKYDIGIPDAMRDLALTFRQRVGDRPVAVCASTRFYHDTDEAALLLQAWKSYTGNALLILIPRHPERFQAAFETAEALGYNVQKRSSGEPVTPDTQVWIGDSMGEIFAYYRTADTVFVGGSLVETGCHNIIEPLACGLPVLFGPYTFNFADTATDAEACGAAVRVGSATLWAETTKLLLSDKTRCRQMGDQALDFVAARKGAGTRMAGIIAKQLGNSNASI